MLYKCVYWIFNFKYKLSGGEEDKYKPVLIALKDQCGWLKLDLDLRWSLLCRNEQCSVWACTDHAEMFDGLLLKRIFRTLVAQSYD